MTGIGKSGLVGQKIAATLASTGTPAYFLHAGEASHGDLGMLMPGDVVLALSYSGETPEVVRLLEFARTRAIRTIAIAGTPGSPRSRARRTSSISRRDPPRGLSLEPRADGVDRRDAGDGGRARDVDLGPPGASTRRTSRPCIRAARSAAAS